MQAPQDAMSTSWVKKKSAAAWMEERAYGTVQFGYCAAATLAIGATVLGICYGIMKMLD
jgi:hypothetical protein